MLTVSTNWGFDVVKTGWNLKYGPWAVVTGASDGIGRAVAVELAGRGINLVLSARRAMLIENLAAELRSRHNIETRVIACDMATKSGMDALIAQTSGLDVGTLIAAAGYGFSGDFLSSDAQTDTNMLAVNCTSSLVLTRHFATQMVQRKTGAIVLFSSVVAFQGAPHSAHYAATKAYIQTFAEGLSYEFKPHNISVVCVAPGPVHTGFAARANMVMAQAETPENVAKATVNAIGKTFLVRPGFLAKMLGYSLSLLPRFVRVVTMGKIMGASVKRSNEPEAKT
jgi:uncharacterized protein